MHVEPRALALILVSIALGCGGAPAESDGGARDAARAPDGGDVDTGTVSDGGAAEDAGADAASTVVGPYVSETRMLDVGGETRTVLVAYPDPAPAGLPLVFSFHGDGGSAAGMRAALALEAEATSGAVFVYPSSVGDAFEYWTYDGHTREADLVTTMIASLSAELGIDTTRVFVTGFSGGAVMANAVACRLERDVIRGIGVSSGSLYSTDGPGGPEFTVSSGAASCALPPAILVWGTADAGEGTVFADSAIPTRDLYVATATCGDTTTAWTDAPCLAYDGCARPVVWCPIEGMMHAVWPGAAHAIWQFFDGLR
jgi:predicted esterase